MSSMPMRAITSTPRRSTRTLTRRTSAKIATVAIEKTRSTSGAQYGSSADGAREDDEQRPQQHGGEHGEADAAAAARMVAESCRSRRGSRRRA